MCFGHFSDGQNRAMSVRFNVINRKIILSFVCLDGGNYPTSGLENVVIPAFTVEVSSDMC